MNKCPVCGNMFQPYSKKQIFCSTKCREQHKGIVKFGRLHCIADISCESENIRNLPPERTDIHMVIALLRDFGVCNFNDMPNVFKNRKELNAWKNKKIRQVFTTC